MGLAIVEDVLIGLPEARLAAMGVGGDEFDALVVLLVDGEHLGAFIVKDYDVAIRLNQQGSHEHSEAVLPIIRGDTY